MGNGPDVTSVYVNSALTNVIKPHKKLSHGSLSASRCSYHTQTLTLLQLKAYILKVVSDSQIGEADLVEFHSRRGVLPRIDLLADGLKIGLGVYDLCNSMHRCRSLGGVNENSGDTYHGVGDHSEILNEGYDSSCAGVVSVYKISSDDYDRNKSHMQKHSNERVGKRHIGACSLFVLNELFVCNVIAAALVIDLGQRLYNSYSLRVLSDHTDHTVNRALTLLEQRDTSSGYKIHCSPKEGKNGYHNKRQYRIERQGYDSTAHKKNRGSDTHSQAHSDKMVNVIGVRGQSRLKAGNGEFIYLS